MVDYTTLAAILGSSAISAYSSNQAAKAQQRAIGNASASSAAATRDALARMDYYDARARSDLAPYRTLGQSALTDYAGLVDELNTPFEFSYDGPDDGRKSYRALIGEMDTPFNFSYDGETPGAFRPTAQYTTPFEFEYDGNAMLDDPGYQFRMAEMERALERGMSARGMNTSGRTMRELARYSGGLAAQGFDADYARNYAAALAEHNSRIDASNRIYGRERDVYESRVNDYDRDFATELTEYNAAVADRNARVGRMASVAAMDQEDYNRSLAAYNSRVADRQGRLARLAGVVGMGQTATNQGVTTGTQSGQIGSQIRTQGGQQMAGLQVAAGNANPYAGYNSAIQGGLQNYFTAQNQQTQNQMTKNFLTQNQMTNNFLRALGNSRGPNYGGGI